MLIIDGRREDKAQRK